MSLESLAHRLLLCIPPEKAHFIGKELMKKLAFAPGNCYNPDFSPMLFGIKLDNPLGLAAGFDKNGELSDKARQYGFSFIEEGSITYHGGDGNPQPRLFRLKPQLSLGNRMGLNGHPAKEVAERLNLAKTPYFAVNIAKTHNPDIVGDEAIEDILGSYRLLKQFGIYTVINISCPNTRDGKTFEEPSSLRNLLAALQSQGKGKPLLIKLSPTLHGEKLDEIIRVAELFVDGYVCGNTLPSTNDQVKWVADKYGKCGISGAMLKPYTLNLIRNVRNKTDKTIIGVGGIFNGKDAFNALQLGANVLQAYTGFIYRGIDYAHKVNAELRVLKDREFAHY